MCSCDLLFFISSVIKWSKSLFIFFYSKFTSPSQCTTTLDTIWKFLLQFHSLISENFLILPFLLITLCFMFHFFLIILLSLIKIFNTKVDILYVDPNQICNFSKVLKYCKILSKFTSFNSFLLQVLWKTEFHVNTLLGISRSLEQSI